MLKIKNGSRVEILDICDRYRGAIGIVVGTIMDISLNTKRYIVNLIDTDVKRYYWL